MTLFHHNSTKYLSTKFQMQIEELPVLCLQETLCLPGVLLPIYLSDPADCQLVYDVQKETGLLAMTHACSETELRQTACLCQIVSLTSTTEGNRLLLVQGLSRVTLLNESSSSKPYRQFECQILIDADSDHHTFNQEECKHELWELFQLLFSEKEIRNLLRETISLLLPLGEFCDLLAGSLSASQLMSSSTISALLGQADVKVRSDLLIESLRELLIQKVSSTQDKQFPPSFSGN